MAIRALPPAGGYQVRRRRCRMARANLPRSKGSGAHLLSFAPESHERLRRANGGTMQRRCRDDAERNAMSAWGIGVWEDDAAHDVILMFDKLRQAGSSAQEALQR